MNRSVPIVVVVGMLSALGVWNLRQWAGAAGETPELARKRLDSIPAAVGDWIGQDQAVNERQMKAASFEAYFSRVYRNSRTGHAVSVMLIYGKPGELGAHDPEFCYGGSGYREIGTRRKHGMAHGELWIARFDSTEIQPASIEVGWAWGSRGTWEAPDEPRYALANRGRIYKIYVQQARNERPETAPLDEFLREFGREVRKALE